MKKYFSLLVTDVFAILTFVFIIEENYAATYGCISSCVLSAIWVGNEVFIEYQDEYIKKLKKKIAEVSG